MKLIIQTFQRCIYPQWIWGSTMTTPPGHPDFHLELLRTEIWTDIRTDSETDIQTGREWSSSSLVYRGWSRVVLSSHKYSTVAADTSLWRIKWREKDLTKPPGSQLGGRTPSPGSPSGGRTPSPGSPSGGRTLSQVCTVPITTTEEIETGLYQDSRAGRGLPNKSQEEVCGDSNQRVESLNGRTVPPAGGSQCAGGRRGRGTCTLATRTSGRTVSGGPGGARGRVGGAGAGRPGPILTRHLAGGQSSHHTSSQIDIQILFISRSRSKSVTRR